ncbi:hypothetical protein PVAND_016761 [Polypedilum vanderplanki]|uniref:F-box domain-containing protein n=1 Tax=Polypedilum vanderplanki TaxID=319348 RepID=A0A9J6BGY1_POLVA|nr:hypothetical protein PVAND_016761 [Polypedilum vanderplanki]
MIVMKNLLNLPNEILIKIFKESKNDKNLSLVCKRFYGVVNLMNGNNLTFEIKSNFLINPNFDFEKLLNECSSINLYSDYFSLKNFDEKFLMFLKFYGNKVVNFTHSNLPTFNITKFIHLMPNLDSFLLNGPTDFMEIENSIEKFSIPLKKLKVQASANTSWNTLEIFDIEELELFGFNPYMKENQLEFISNCKNLKKFKVNNYCGFLEIIDVLKRKKLESLEMSFLNLQDENIVEFIKTQENLISLTVKDFDTKILSEICENLKKLEILELQFDQDYERKDFMEISLLKNLKSLTVRGQKLKLKNVEDLCSFSLPKLESLTIHVNYNITQNIVTSLVQNFNTLKSLDIEGSSSCYHNLVPEILENFTNLEKLNIAPFYVSEDHEADIDEKFYLTSHKNVKLKFLNITICCFNPRKLLRKIIKDFPNLEKFPDEFLNSYHKLLCEEIPNFPIFRVDLNSATDANELLRNCSVYLGFGDENIVRATRDGKRQITFNIRRYFNNQQLQAMLMTPRKLKTIKLELKVDQNKITVDNFVTYLRLIGQNVEKLTITNRATISQLKQIIEVFPKLEIIEFINVQFDENNFKTLRIKKVKEILLHFDINNFNHFTEITKQIEIFCNFFYFPENNLQHFKLTITRENESRCSFDPKSIEKFLENQKPLTEINERWELKDTKHNFIYEAQLKK